MENLEVIKRTPWQNFIERATKLAEEKNEDVLEFHTPSQNIYVKFRNAEGHLKPSKIEIFDKQDKLVSVHDLENLEFDSNILAQILDETPESDFDLLADELNFIKIEKEQKEKLIN